jgi:hypothetical protein
VLHLLHELALGFEPVLIGLGQGDHLVALALGHGWKKREGQRTGLREREKMKKREEEREEEDEEEQERRRRRRRTRRRTRRKAGNHVVHKRKREENEKKLFQTDQSIGLCCG